MTFEREIGRLLLGLLLGLLLVVGSAAYWAVAGPEGILQRDDNPRRVEFERSIRRGAIFDVHDSLLAQSVMRGGRFPIREYTQPAFFGTIGYYSFRYGTGGVEAFYDAQLSGRAEPESWERWWRESVLGLPRIGTDVRLTLDGVLQQAASDAFAGLRGAVVALDAERGDIRVLLSRPTYDPNVLDEQWAELSQSPENPFFNRALQGQYQPGGALNLPIVLLMALGGVDASTMLSQVDDPVLVEDVVITCTLTPPALELTLQAALLHGCPSAVVHLVSALDASAVRATLASFELRSIPPVDDARTTLIDVPSVQQTASNLLADVLGQGQIVVNPLAFARFLGAVVSEGTVPALRLIDAIRPPEQGWQLQLRSRHEVSLVTPRAAQQGREWLLAAGDLLQLPDGMGGYAAVARSGQETLVWFGGFVAKGDEQLVVVVIVENTDDIRAAVSIGEAVLNAYRDASSTPTP